MATPGDLRYSPAHIWVRVDGDVATVGITDNAQEHLGAIIYLQLPGAGGALRRDAPFGLIDSSKATEDLIAPVDGEVVASNEEMARRPRLVNDSPYERGWLVQVRLADAVQTGRLLDDALVGPSD